MLYITSLLNWSWNVNLAGIAIAVVALEPHVPLLHVPADQPVPPISVSNPTLI